MGLIAGLLEASPNERRKRMKSYKEHLLSTQNYGEKQKVDYRPTMRSSAVFPLIHKPDRIISMYTFMGYWLRKRNIPLVTVLVTVRNKNGKKISIQNIEVKEVKSFEISSLDILKQPNEEFTGSAEIEIFSAVDMVFPYPAITYALKGVNGLTFVHTCGRIYNDFDDLNANNEQLVSETGFDLFIGKDYTPFFSFVNGPIAIENKEIELEYINQKDERKRKTIKLDDVNPYGLGWVNLKIDTGEVFDNNLIKACVKVKHDFKGFFPRFVAGNVLRDFEDVSLTHSYYDTSTDKSDNAVWKNPNVEDFEDSVVTIPFDTDFSEIELAIYPIFASSPVNLSFELYNPSGQMAARKSSNIRIGTNDDKLKYIDFIELFSEYRNNIPMGMIRIIATGEGNVPTRMKYGLNFCNPTKNTNLPSNICFAATLPNDKILDKPGAFRWCPIFNTKSQKIFLHNSSFVKAGFKDAKIDIEVYRLNDAKKMNWSINLPYNGSFEIINPYAEALDKFLCGSVGWVSFTCNSPFIFGYYITDLGKGVIGADHLY